MRSLATTAFHTTLPNKNNSPNHQHATCTPLPSDTFHDKLFACDQGDDAEYDHDPRGGAVALYATCMLLPSDTFHDKLFAYDQGDDAEYDRDPRRGAVDLYATCIPLPSDTFHDKLIAYDQRDDAGYDHDNEEGLWLSMQPVCLCRRTPFMISSLQLTMLMTLTMIMTTKKDCDSVCNLV